MMIEKYIRQLLFAHDCVVIPDFGGFIAKYAPATIHPVRHTFLPPSKEIAFNEMLRLNDGLLISHVAVGEKITRDEATRLIREFTDYVRGQIHYAKKYTFEEIGTLSLTPELRMIFEPLNRVNYLQAGYGLPELSFKPIERRMSQPKIRTKDRPAISQLEEEVEETNTRVLRRNRQLWYALGLSAVLGFSALTGYFFFNEGTNLGSFNPFSFLINMHSEEDSTVSQTEAEINRKRIESQAKADSMNPALLPELSIPEEVPLIQHEGHTQEPSGIAAVVPPAETKSVTEENTEPTKVVAEKETAKKSEIQKVAKRMDEKIEAEKAVAEKHTKPVAKSDSTPKTIVADNTSEKTGKTTARNKSRYYIIVNGFSVEANAAKFCKQLVSSGFESAYVFPRGSNGLIKVSIADYATQAEADAQVNEFRKQYSEAWVLRPSMK